MTHFSIKYIGKSILIVHFRNCKVYGILYVYILKINPLILFQNEFYMHCNPTFYATLLCPTKRNPAALSIYLAHEIKYQVSKQQR